MGMKQKIQLEKYGEWIVKGSWLILAGIFIGLVFNILHFTFEVFDVEGEIQYHLRYMGWQNVELVHNAGTMYLPVEWKIYTDETLNQQYVVNQNGEVVMVEIREYNQDDFALCRSMNIDISKKTEGFGHYTKNGALLEMNYYDVEGEKKALISFHTPSGGASTFLFLNEEAAIEYADDIALSARNQ